MKAILLLSGLLLTATAVQAQRIHHDWEDNSILQYNRLPARASFVPFTHTEGDCFQSLDGVWKFHWSPTPEGRIDHFETMGFQPQSGDWNPLSVPATWEMNGYGTPVYISAGYSFRIDPPYVTTEPPKSWTTYVERNPTGQYIRTFSVPESWLNDGGRTMVRMEGVASAFYVWVNGEKVGYSQGAMEPAEFDITSALRHNDHAFDQSSSTHTRNNAALGRGEQKIAIEVYKYSDGAYLEDQDFWRLAGINRPVYLIHTPALRIEDVTVRTTNRTLSGANEADVSYQLDVDPELVWSGMNGTQAGIEKGLATVKGCLLKATLFDAEGAEVTHLQCNAADVLDLEHKAALMNTWFPQRGPRKTGRMTATVSNVHEWTAETPYLYTLTLALTDSLGTPMQQLKQKVGFRTLEIRHGQFLVNNRPIRLRGVNRHEHDPKLGRVMTDERMLQDILLMKRAGINAVRTSHYPNNPRWYELCDSLGIYVMDEAGIETHGLRGTLASNPTWQSAFLDRAIRMAERDKNHPCVILWSMGNESGYGPNFAAVSAWLHDFDPTRFVHSEGAQGYIMPTSAGESQEVDYRPDPTTVDVISRFYPRVQADYLNPGMSESEDKERAENARWERLLSIAQRTDTFHGGLLDGMIDDRPVLTSEYSHAMGNAIGNLDRYWQEIYSHPRMLGGFIWDWVDQGFTIDNPNYAKNNPAASKSIDTNTNANESRNITTNNAVNPVYYGGDFGDKPNSGTFCLNGIVLCDRSVTAKYRTVKQVYSPVCLFDAGNQRLGIINHNHHTTLDNYRLCWQLTENGKQIGKGGEITIPQNVEPGDTAYVDFPTLPKYNAQKDVRLNLSVTLRKSTPWAEAGYEIYNSQLALADHPLAITEGIKPYHSKTLTADSLLQLLKSSKLQVWRAPVDNDKMFGNWLAKEWQKQNLEAPVRTKISENVERYQYVYGSILVTSEWKMNADGSVELLQSYQAEGTLPDLPRLGIQLQLPASLEQLTWYGLGPDETYPDRLIETHMGLWQSTVGQQYTHYPKPQDGGNHEGTTRLSLLDKKGHGLCITALPVVDANRQQFTTPWDNDGTPGFSFQALHYTPDELANTRHDFELKGTADVILNLDCAIMGIGNSSCGPGVLKEFSLNTKLPYQLHLKFQWQ